jgi:hypothetical protein
MTTSVPYVVFGANCHDSMLIIDFSQLKTQYAAMYREAVNKYKSEVVENLTVWGYPIPPLNIRTQVQALRLISLCVSHLLDIRSETNIFCLFARLSYQYFSCFQNDA